MFNASGPLKATGEGEKAMGAAGTEQDHVGWQLGGIGLSEPAFRLLLPYEPSLHPCLLLTSDPTLESMVPLSLDWLHQTHASSCDLPKHRSENMMQELWRFN